MSGLSKVKMSCLERAGESNAKTGHYNFLQWARLHCDVEKSPHCLTAVTPFCKVGGEEGFTEASGSATKRRKIFPNYFRPLGKRLMPRCHPFAEAAL